MIFYSKMFSILRWECFTKRFLYLILLDNHSKKYLKWLLAKVHPCENIRTNKLKKSSNHLFHLLYFLTDIEQSLRQLHLTVRNFTKFLTQHSNHIVMPIERSTYLQLKRLQVKFQVSFCLLYFWLEDGLETIFLIFKTDHFKFVLGELLLDDENLAVDLL